MSREKQRQRKRILDLANFIQQNPKQYNQNEPDMCVLGLMNRLHRGVLNQKRVGYNQTELSQLAYQRFGISKSLASSIWLNDWAEVSPQFQNEDIFSERSVEEAIRLLRYLAG